MPASHPLHERGPAKSTSAVRALARRGLTRRRAPYTPPPVGPWKESLTKGDRVAASQRISRVKWGPARRTQLKWRPRRRAAPRRFGSSSQSRASRGSRAKLVSARGRRDTRATAGAGSCQPWSSDSGLTAPRLHRQLTRESRYMIIGKRATGGLRSRQGFSPAVRAFRECRRGHQDAPTTRRRERA